MKPHVAMIVPGGVGKDQNIPSLVQLIYRLSTSYIIHLYSFSSEELHPLLVGQKIVYIASFHKRRLFSMIYFFFTILKDHRDFNFSLIQSFWISPAGWLAFCAKMYLGVPFVITLPGGDTVYLPSIHYGGMRSLLHRQLIQWCCHNADQVVVLSQFQKFIMRMNDIRSKKIHIIPYGVDTAQFHFQPKQISTPLRLISIGSINRVKDVSLQIQTVTSLRRHIDCTLMIVGPDLMNGENQKLAKQLHVTDVIEWKGQTKHSDIPSLLQSAHILLHSSRYDAEAVVIMEAFSAGTVVVGTRVGLLADRDSDGEYTVDTSDADILAEKILSIVQNPKQYRSLQEKNRRYAEQYTIDWTAAQYDQMYQELTLASLK
jgi:glycosyltransferase involved in cell wall biosynthesis